jgi:predicted dehydrogenase
MKKKIRIGVIGAGMYAGTAHMPALRKFKEVEVPAICRKSKDRLKQFQQMFKIPRGYTDYRQMLQKEDLDGVLIASPHALHYEHARAALERDIPVLIEKPMALKVSHAKEIVRLSEKKRIPVVVGFNRHFWANFCYTKKMIEENEIGEVRFVSARWVADIEWALARTEPPGYFRTKAFYKEGDAPNFRGDPKLAGGGMFIDGGSHVADAILWTTGLRPTQIAAFMDNRGFATDCDATLSAVMNNRALLSCTIMGASKTFKGHELYIHGTKGTIFVDDYSVIYQLNGQKEVQVVELPGDSSPATNFVRVLQGRERPHCTAKDGLRAVIFVDAAYRAAKSGAIVSISGWVD